MQLQVLSLYRKFLRVARDKPGAVEHVRKEFREKATIPRMETLRIEHLIRRAERQLKDLSNPSIKGIGVFEQEAKGAPTMGQAGVSTINSEDEQNSTKERTAKK